MPEWLSSPEKYLICRQKKCCDNSLGFRSAFVDQHNEQYPEHIISNIDKTELKEFDEKS